MKKITLFFFLCGFLLLYACNRKETSFYDNVKKYYNWGYLGIPSKNNFGYFSISGTEISNRDYNIFLNFLLQKNKFEAYNISKPDSSAWVFEDKLTFKEYFSSEKYQNYPVVCISYEAAEIYCKWREQMTNQNSIEKEKIVVRLPTEEEWVAAIRNIYPDAIYGVGGDKILDKKNYYLANFKSESQKYLKKNESLIPLRPVNSFNPNDAGVYCMTGNVSEMILEKGKAKGGHWNSNDQEIRIDSVGFYSKPSVYVGFRPVLFKKHYREGWRNPDRDAYFH